MSQKKCKKCNHMLSLSNFYVNKASKDGRGSLCKDCVKEVTEQNRKMIQPIVDRLVVTNGETDRLLETRHMSNRTLAVHISGKLAEERDRREVKEQLEKLTPDGIKISAEKFLKSKLFDRSVRYGSDWY